MPKKEATPAAAAGAPQTNSLYIGIDFGTFRTAVSTSDGKKVETLSIVGKPRDPVASKYLKKEVLYGEEALEHRAALELSRPMKHGVFKNLREDVEAAKGLLEHVLREAGVFDREIEKYAIVGVPAEASVLNKKTMLDIVRSFVNNAMVVSEPFCVAYNLGKLENAIIVDIGAGTTDICRVHGTLPEAADQISSTKAGDYIDLVLMDAISKRYKDAKVTSLMARKWKESFGFMGNHVKEVIVKLPVEASSVEVSITSELRNACESVLPDIVDAIYRLVSTYDPDLQDELKKNIVLAGGGSQIRGIGARLEEALAFIGGCKVSVVEDPIYCGADGALKLAQDMPEDYWKNLR